MTCIKIIGAGLAGTEAAWQCARRGLDVELFEMRPVRSTPAHQTADFAVGPSQRTESFRI